MAMVTRAAYRSRQDYQRALARAEARRERRLARVMEHRGWFPSPATWRDLDLVHEATYLIDRIERVVPSESELRAEWGDR